MLKMQRLGWLFAVVAGAGGLSLLSGCDKSSSAAPTAPPPPPGVTVQTPIKQTVNDFLDYTGQTEATETVEVRARVEGILQSIQFKDGQEVKTGDLLFEIEPATYIATLERAKAAQSSDEANLRLAQIRLDRNAELVKTKNVSQYEYDQSVATRDQATAAVDGDKAAVRTAEINLGYCKIYAPLNGRISRHQVSVGNLVGRNDATLLTTIVAVKPIFCYVNVSENDVLMYRQKQREGKLPKSANGDNPIYLGLANEPGFPHKGIVNFVENRLDPTTGTLQIRCTFENADEVIGAGLYARVRAPLERREAFLVPELAVLSDQAGKYLLVVDDKQQVARLPVTTGPLFEPYRVIETGLAGGEKVIINGLQKARPGGKVTPTEEPAPATIPTTFDPQQTPAAAPTTQPQ